MLFIGGELVADAKILFNCIADRIQPSISHSIDNRFLITAVNGHFCHNSIYLLKMTLFNLKIRGWIQVMIGKYLIYPLGREFLMLLVGYLFHHVSDLFPHRLWEGYAKILLQYIIHTALTRLAVDADYIRIIRASDILRIDWKIRYTPFFQIFVFTPLHSLGNGILMGAGKCRKDKIPCIGLTLIHMHPCKILIIFANPGHIRKIKSGIHTMGKHIHGQCNNIYISRALPIPKQSSLYTVRTGKQAKFRSCHTASPVIVRVKG